MSILDESIFEPAVAAPGEIQIDGQEIVDAHWFGYDEMPVRFPGSVSISQWLIDDFLSRRRRG
jgi:NADH pyrophosphatase NudC (nudix superfamily)